MVPQTPQAPTKPVARLNLPEISKFKKPQPTAEEPPKKLGYFDMLTKARTLTKKEIAQKYNRGLWQVKLPVSPHLIEYEKQLTPSTLQSEQSPSQGQRALYWR